MGNTKVYPIASHISERCNYHLLTTKFVVKGVFTAAASFSSMGDTRVYPIASHISER
ncbi:MAG: hypothetical protein IJ942_04870 [Alistipes sp.]|nr:hypothetical protein [Alistipes sp.]